MSNPITDPKSVTQAEPQRGVPLTFVRSVDVSRSVEEVFDYASDFSRAYEWRVEVVRSAMDPPAPMRAGTKLREESRLAGRRVVTESMVDDCEHPHRYTFVHLSGPMPVSGEYAVTPTSAGARLTYTLRVRLQGWWMLLAPLFRLTGGRTMQQSLAKFAANLESTGDVSRH